MTGLARHHAVQRRRNRSDDPIGLLGGFNPYGYVHNPVGWVDPYGLAGADCDKLLNPDWTNHGFKHFPQKNMPWKDIVKSTKTGPAKYTPEINIEVLERSVYKTGQPATNGKPWKVQDMGEIIGASEGKPSQWMRVEYSGGTIHGHPISLKEFRKLTK